MTILRDVFFGSKFDSIFINLNGDQVYFEGPNKVKEALEMLKGQALIPYRIENEVISDYVSTNDIYSVDVNENKYIYVNLITYNPIQD